MTHRSFAVVGVLAVAAAFLSGCANSASQPEASQGQAVACSYPVHGNAAKPVDPPNTKDIISSGIVEYTLEMTAGKVKLTLDRANAPCAVNSFESLVQQGYYDNTTCHRLVDSGIFILQCGDPSGTGRGTPGYSYADELTGKETYGRGTVAMANAGKDTNGSQFFLVWDDSPLGPDYTVLGTMDEESTNVVAEIASQGVDGTDGISPIADATITQVVAG